METAFIDAICIQVKNCRFYQSTREIWLDLIKRKPVISIISETTTYVFSPALVPRMDSLFYTIEALRHQSLKCALRSRKLSQNKGIPNQPEFVLPAEDMNFIKLGYSFSRLYQFLCK